jgi:RNA polymerase sigma factor (sigma-70 family)
MTGSATKRQLKRAPAPSDEELIARCLADDSEAWSALIDRYKNLIYSIPIRLGMHQEAGDIFQLVCVDLLSKLPQLREPRALPKWLMQTCYHECLRYRRTSGREDSLDADSPEPHATEQPTEEVLIRFQQEQTVRHAIFEMPVRCAWMIRMLFFESPVRAYEDVARELGVATGSIGFIRNRCLARLRKSLEKKGF